jgi:two-component system NarL family response regulator
LTERETEVLHLIAEGYTDREIGKALYIAENTVKTRVKDILAKLNARNRTHAVTVGFRNGLVE